VLKWGQGVLWGIGVHDRGPWCVAEPMVAWLGMQGGSVSGSTIGVVWWGGSATWAVAVLSHCSVEVPCNRLVVARPTRQT
jgi:hypothetical protein